MKTMKNLPMLLFLCMLLFGAPFLGCRGRLSSGLQKDLAPVALCRGGVLTILPLIAQQQGFDKQEGLAIILNLISSGVSSDSQA